LDKTLNYERACKKLRPQKTRFDIVRIGGIDDGGYLLPDDFDDIAACFSPGVSETATFEIDLLQKKGSTPTWQITK
jgi:hypothetical protein